MIFASHSPPDLPPSPVPSVQILRLASPLVVEDAGAARLASTLEWAERIARSWRASGSNNAGVLYYDEATKDVPLPRSGSFSRSFVQRCRSNSLSGPLFTGSLPPVDPSQRPFDAILNYISHGVTQKHVLKQTILVTSITRPFLAPTFSPYHRLSGVKRNSGQGLGSRAHSLSPAPPYQSGDLLATTARGVTATHPSASAVSPPCSHMVHIVPPNGAHQPHTEPGSLPFFVLSTARPLSMQPTLAELIVWEGPAVGALETQSPHRYHLGTTHTP